MAIRAGGRGQGIECDHGFRRHHQSCDGRSILKRHANHLDWIDHAVLDQVIESVFSNVVPESRIVALRDPPQDVLRIFAGVACDLPQWLEPYLERVFGNELEREMAALNGGILALIENFTGD